MKRSLLFINLLSSPLPGFLMEVLEHTIKDCQSIWRYHVFQKEFFHGTLSEKPQCILIQDLLRCHLTPQWFSDIPVFLIFHSCYYVTTVSKNQRIASQMKPDHLLLLDDLCYSGSKQELRKKKKNTTDSTYLKSCILTHLSFWSYTKTTSSC